ncbi:unnamed protein product [Calicophoron daubneyi]|uniref:SET domain-containing protein n=1 Tax=Calicophoron daubneyi TaxID=300641 RepID=A0AAV2TYT0_CALDB
MLGLAPHADLMDTLIYPSHYAVSLNLPVTNRRINGLRARSPEPDPILEDTPDAPDDNVDYTVYPPDVGQNLIVDELGREVAICDTPSKHAKRVLCSFSSQSVLDGSDPDDYPFHAVSYGETGNSMGLPYNDHNYASTKPQPPAVSSEDEDRLSLLAKLALAKDDKQTEHFTAGQRRMQNTSGLGLIITSDEVTNNATYPRPPGSGAAHITPSYNTTRYQSASCSSDNRSLISTVPSSLIATNTRLPNGGSHAYVLTSPRQMSSPPLQVHKVSSSLTPHIVLRTGMPGLQINTTNQGHRPSNSGSSESSSIIRCPCGSAHSEGYLIQCEKCRACQHAECVLPSNSTRISSPYICDRCSPRQSHPLPVQRHKLASLVGTTATPTSGIRISRATTLGTGSTSARIFVTTPGICSTPSRQLHVCLPSANTLAAGRSGQTEFSILSSNGERGPGTRYFAPRSNSLICHSQPVRSSKRKQDLVNLTGVNSGLECLSNNSVSEDLNDLSAVQSSFASGTASMGCADVQATTAGISTPVSEQKPAVTMNQDLPVQSTGSSLQRLLMQYADQANNQSTETAELQRASPPSSTMSSESPNSSPIDGYEEASRLRLSERLNHKLADLLPSIVSSPILDDPDGYFKEEIPPRLSSLQRCSVVSFDFNRKGLVAAEDLYPGEPIIEYRGFCMLASEYNEMYDYRKHYNPFVLFYDTWAKLHLCVDARKYGNEARFIRRSCTANCQVRHSFSPFDDLAPGRTPGIRLIIFATRPISKSTELTLPFDFDFTTCRYLVRCACSRKACPVARWFRQNVHFGGNSLNSTSSSLLYSRKLPLCSRISGQNSRSRISSMHDNYSDILNEDYDQDEKQYPSRWSDDYLNEKSPPITSHLWPRRTFRRVSRARDSIPVPVNLSRPKRGRGRGRRRGTATSLLPNCRGSKAASRGRPSLNRPLSSIKRRRPAYVSGRARRRLRSSRIKSHDSSPSLSAVNSADEYSTESKKISSDKSFKREGGNTENDGDQLARSGFQKVSDFEDRNRQKSPVAHMDDSDVDTEPECESDFHSALSKHEQRRQSLSTVSNGGNESGLSQRPLRSKSATKVEGESDVGSLPLERELKRNSKPGKRSSFSSGDRAKRRHSTEGDVPNPPPKRVSNERENAKKKSREEIWMAEVLRRIERMEKKQLKHRNLSGEAERPRTESSSKEEEDDVLLPSPKSLRQSPTKRNMNLSNPPNLQEADFSPKDEIKQMNSSSECGLSSVITYPEEPVSPPTEPSEHEAKSLMDPCSGEPETRDEEKSRSSNSDNVNPMDMCTAVKCCQSRSPREEEDPDSLSNLTGLTLSDTSIPVSNEKVEPHTPVSRTRRRRSQAALLSDGLTPAPSEQRGSREDRWLKSQLRRIAELEVIKNRSPSTITKTELNDIVSSSDGISSESSDGPSKALKDVSNNDNSAHVEPCLDSPKTSNESETEGTPINETQNEQNCPSTHAESVGLSCTGDLKFSRFLRNDRRKNHTLISPDSKTLASHADSDADCELIVYRTREKDPLAKFSRGRSKDLNSAVQSTPSQENTPPVSSELEASQHQCASAPKHTLPSTRSAPRPTKKRWLSQALMEDDTDFLSSGLTATADAVTCERPAGRLTDPEDQSQIQQPPDATVSSTVCTVCPVNPKKRLISQFSELGGRLLNDSQQDLERNDLGISDVHQTEVESAKVPVPCDISQNEVFTDKNKPICDPLSCHSTPLPPKKATVKQQAEQMRLQEMRKVKVSLSEYRRRRGLSTVASTNASKIDKPVERRTFLAEKPAVSDKLDHLPQVLASPTRLLNELPKMYQQIHKPGKSDSYSIAPLQEILGTLPKNLDDLEPFISRESASDQVPDDKLTPTVEDAADGRGPRTPSEPPDDEDGVDLGNGVYVRQSDSSHNMSDQNSSAIESGNEITEHTVRSPEVNELGADLIRNQDEVRSVDIHPTRTLSTPLFPIIEEKVDADQIKEASSAFATQVMTKDPNQCCGNSPFYASYPRPEAHVRSHSDSAPVRLGSAMPRMDSPSSAPPPPPPPFPSFNPHPSVDFSLNRSDVDTTRRFPSSDAGSLDVGRKSDTMQYFIKRDQEIRQWQETRSYEWERKRSSHRHRNGHHRVGHERKLNQNFSGSLKQSLSGDRQLSRVTLGMSGQLNDVERTLSRLQDSLRAQLDQTRLALTPRLHAPNDVVPSLNGGFMFGESNELNRFPYEDVHRRERTGSSPSQLHYFD